MPAYVVLDVTVTDPLRYDEYKKLAPQAVEAYGGSYIARGGRSETLEGGWEPSRLVILRFDGVEKAKQWLDSPEYKAAKALRHEAATTNMVVVEGV